MTSSKHSYNVWLVIWHRICGCFTVFSWLDILDICGIISYFCKRVLISSLCWWIAQVFITSRFPYKLLLCFYLSQTVMLKVLRQGVSCLQRLVRATGGAFSRGERLLAPYAEATGASGTCYAWSRISRYVFFFCLSFISCWDINTFTTKGIIVITEGKYTLIP